MNEQLQTTIRAVLVSLVSILVTQGYLDNGQLQIIVGAIVALGATGWGIYNNRKAGLLASAAATGKLASPIVVTDQKLADSIPSDKVIGPTEAAVAKVKSDAAAVDASNTGTANLY